MCQVIFWSKKELLVNYGSLQVHVFVGTQHLVLRCSERTRWISRGSPKEITFTFTVHLKMILHETELSSKAAQQCIWPCDKWTQQFCTLLTAAARPPAVVPRGGWGSWTVLSTAAIPPKHQHWYLSNPGITKSRSLQIKSKRWIWIWINWFLLFPSLPIPFLQEKKLSVYGNYNAHIPIIIRKEKKAKWMPFMCPSQVFFLHTFPLLLQS